MNATAKSFSIDVQEGYFAIVHPGRSSCRRRVEFGWEIGDGRNGEFSGRFGTEIPW